MPERLTKCRLILLCIALSAASLPREARAQLHLGIEGGWGSGCKDAVEGFPASTFQGAGVFGGSLGYRFGFGLDLELAFLQTSPKLVENGQEFGTVTLAPILLRVGYWGVPADTGFGGHLAVGFGGVASSFKKGPYILALESQYGATFDSWAKGDSFAFDLVGGVEYFAARWLSVGADARLLLARRGTQWQLTGPGGSAPVPDVNTYVLLSGQITAVLRFWLRL